MRWLGLSGSDKRKLEELFDQQMWCWGCDVRREAGNLLLAYGGVRLPSPEPRLRSAYHFIVYPSCELTLWGWGVWAAAEKGGSLFIRRARFAMVWRAEAHRTPRAWCERDLAPLLADAQPADERALSLLQAALSWIADYENWIADQFGSAYRAPILQAYPQRQRCKNVIAADGMAAAWREMNDIIRSSVFNQTEKQG